MDNMPPLPNSEYGLSFYDEGGAHELPGRSYTADQMHAYARAYAEQRCAPLVAALANLIEAADSMRWTYGCIWGDTPEDSDTYTHDKWAEEFLHERADESRAALAAEQEKQHG